MLEQLRRTKRRAPFVALAAAAIVLAVAGCGGGSSTSSTSTSGPAVTPTAGVAATATKGVADTPTAGAAGTPSALNEQPGDDGFRAFARKFDTVVRRDDVAFIRLRMRTTPVDCTGPDINTPGGPSCDYPGQRYDGIGVAHWRSEGGIGPANAVLDQFGGISDNALPTEKDQFGDGAPQVYALNVDPKNYVAIVTAIVQRPSNFSGSGPLRIAIGTNWEYVDGAWQMTGVMYGYVLGEELLQPPSAVPESPYPKWERFQAS